MPSEISDAVDCNVFDGLMVRTEVNGYFCDFSSIIHT